VAPVLTSLSPRVWKLEAWALPGVLGCRHDPTILGNTLRESAAARAEAGRGSGGKVLRISSLSFRASDPTACTPVQPASLHKAVDISNFTAQPSRSIPERMGQLALYGFISDCPNTQVPMHSRAASFRASGLSQSIPKAERDALAGEIETVMETFMASGLQGSVQSPPLLSCTAISCCCTQVSMTNAAGLAASGAARGWGAGGWDQKVHKSEQGLQMMTAEILSLQAKLGAARGRPGHPVKVAPHEQVQSQGLPEAQPLRSPNEAGHSSIRRAGPTPSLGSSSPTTSSSSSSRGSRGRGRWARWSNRGRRRSP